MNSPALIYWMSFLGRNGKEFPIYMSEGSVSITGPVLWDDVQTFTVEYRCHDGVLPLVTVLDEV